MRALILLLVISFNLFSTQINAQTTKEIKVVNFTKLNFEGSSTFIIIQSDNNKLEVETNDDDVISYIDITNKNNTLTINTTNKNKNITNICSKLRFLVYVKNLKLIEIEGAGKILAEDEIISNNLKVILKGSGNINIKVKCNNFEAIMKGSSYLRVKGVTKNSDIKVNGVGTISAADLLTENTTIIVKGVGNAKVNATNTLNATINGVGSIEYSGNPKNKNFNTNGIGTINKL